MKESYDMGAIMAMVMAIATYPSWLLPIFCIFMVSGVKVTAVIMLVVNYFCGGSYIGACKMVVEETLPMKGLFIWYWINLVVKTIITIVCINWLWF